MRKMMLAALTCSMMAFTVGPAAAQSVCKGKMVIDTVYQKGRSGKFEYFFMIQNTSMKIVKADVRIKNMPGGVNIFSQVLAGISLTPQEKRPIRFASGTNNQISDGTVRKFYDTDDSGSSPALIVTNCLIR